MEEEGCSFDVEWECRINKWLNSGFGTYNPGILNYNTFNSTTVVDRISFSTVNKRMVYKMKTFSHIVQLME